MTVVSQTKLKRQGGEAVTEPAGSWPDEAPVLVTASGDPLKDTGMSAAMEPAGSRLDRVLTLPVKAVAPELQWSGRVTRDLEALPRTHLDAAMERGR
jgi:hypothetical protein